MTIARDLAPRAARDGERPASEGPYRRYRLCGSLLASGIEFPELIATESAEAPRWTFRIDRAPALPVESVVLGERQLGRETYTLARTSTGLRLHYSHAGTFDLLDGGRELVWHRREGAPLELVRSIVLGPLLALSLEVGGLLCLHGSAVAIDNQAIVFLGPKHHGKSTLATALTAAGARLIGDDLVAVAPTPPAMVSPGVPSVRLWDDAADVLALGTLCGSIIPGIKTTASGFAERAVMQEPTPLAAVYLLEPAMALDDFTCSRARLPAAAAAIGLAQQAKLADSLIGMLAATAHLSAAARLAATVPVWKLGIARDLARLPLVVSEVMAWHRDARS